VDQLLALVVLSNASPNSWMLLGVVVSSGAFLPAGPVLVTSVHGDVVAGIVSWMLLWPICRVPTACAIVSSRGELVLLWAVPEGKGVEEKAQAMLFSPAVVEVQVPLLIAGDWLVFLLLAGVRMSSSSRVGIALDTVVTL